MTGELLEYFDWERADEQDPNSVLHGLGLFPEGAARRLGAVLALVPERARQAVVRTIAWCALEPGFSAAERPLVLAALREAGAVDYTEPPRTFEGLCRAGMRYLWAGDANAFQFMVTLFEELRRGAYGTPAARATDTFRWLQLVVLPPHGDGGAMSDLVELVETIPAGPRRFRAALFDGPEFAQVWSTDDDFQPQECVIRMPEPHMWRRKAEVEPEVAGAYATSLATEYLVERCVLFSALADEYEDMATSIEYRLPSGSWLHSLW